MKVMTRSEAEAKRQKAVEFLRRIGNDGLADEFDNMDAEGYAEHKRAELIENPNNSRSKSMPSSKSKAELESELDEANDYIEELESKLDQIAGIATDEEEDQGEDDDSDDSGDDGEDGDLD
jgi:hypothetical protein